MAVDLVIRGGRVWSSRGSTMEDIYVSDGKIVAVGGELDASERVDASGLEVLPGVVDAHVHIPDPDIPEREDFLTGTAAALSNGTTTLLEHHHSLPVKNVADLREKEAYLAGRSLVDFGLIAHGRPDNLDDLEDLWQQGIYAFKIFTCALHGAPAVPSDVMLDLFRRVAAFDGYCLVHCEDDRITAANEERLRAAGSVGGEAILGWRTLEAELVAVATTTLLARLTGARIGIAHVSHPDVLDIIKREQESGADVAVESCPHYFYLNDEIVRRRGAWAKFTPPARAHEFNDEMWRRLEGGEIDMISADHAPATREEKSRGTESMWEAPFGIPGVETTLALMLNGAAEGWISLATVARVMAEGPARVYGLSERKGALAPGLDADMVLVDLEGSRSLRHEDVRSRVGWTPYDGSTLKGSTVMTISRGSVVFWDGQVLADPGWGTYIPRPGSLAADGVRV
ncbi:MAG: amidohydrolase family protein [Dehalococcoidia bacterium]|nr:amidohydrolase family protein [Dehalococcoidia bacterium]